MTQYVKVWKKDSYLLTSLPSLLLTFLTPKNLYFCPRLYLQIISHKLDSWCKTTTGNKNIKTLVLLVDTTTVWKSFFTQLITCQIICWPVALLSNMIYWFNGIRSRQSFLAWRNFAGFFCKVDITVILVLNV